MRALRATVLTLAAAAGGMLAGCGQKGALYLPEATGNVITRPMQTPDPAAAPSSQPTSTPAGETPSADAKKPATPPAEQPATP